MPPRKQENMVVYSVRIDQETLDKLRRMAEAGSRMVSQEVQLALRTWAKKAKVK